MKVIGTLPSMSAVLERQEEIWPERGTTAVELQELVRKRYEFQHGPDPSMAAITNPTIFVSGRFPGGDGFAIGQLAMYAEGDVAVCQTTELADRVVDDLVAALDENLGFRFRTANLERRRVSNLVFEFDEPIDHLLSAIGTISALADARSERGPLGFKRLAFGDQNMAPINDYLEACRRVDFHIERRVGAPEGSNWFFSGAPMSTAAHVALLTEIEQALTQLRN